MDDPSVNRDATSDINMAEKLQMIQSMRENGLRLKDANLVHRDDKDIVGTAVASNGAALRYASERLRNDPEIVTKAYQSDWRSFPFAGTALKRNKSFLLEMIRINGQLLDFFPPAFKGDEEFLWDAIKVNPTALVHVKPTSRFFDDKKIVLHSLKSSCTTAIMSNEIFDNVSTRLKDDREVIQAAVEKNGFAFLGASTRLQEEEADAELVLDALGNICRDYTRLFFQGLPIQWRKDPKVLLAAARVDEGILQHVPPNSEIFTDRMSVETILKYSPRAFQYVSLTLRADPELVLQAVQKWGKAWNFASEEIKETNRDIALAAVASDGAVLEDMPDIWKMDRGILQRAIEGGTMMHYVWRQVIPEQFQNDRAFVLESIKKILGVFTFIPHDLQNDREIVLQTVITNASLCSIPDEMMDSEVVMAVIKQESCGGMLMFAPAHLRQDPKMVAVALKNSGYDNDVSHPSGVWHSEWHNMKQRLQALQDRLLLDESSSLFRTTILHSLYYSRGQFKIMKEKWISSRLETCWLVGWLGANDGVRLDPDAREIVIQFAGLPQVTRELQQLSPVIEAISLSNGKPTAFETILKDI